MYLRELRYFVALVEEGSVASAAQRLRIAGPALYLHLRSMEADFGTPLLVDSANGLVLTREGDILLDTARSLIRQFDAMRDRLKRRRLIDELPRAS